MAAYAQYFRGGFPLKQYLDLLERVLDHGVSKGDRTGTGTVSIFGADMRFDLNDGFPLVTTKYTHLKSIVHELLWFISGSTNVRYLQENGVKIWDAWADENGELGPVYGSQWRFWMDPRKGFAHKADPDGYITYGTIDQLAQVIEGIKKDPDGRRHLVSAWNPSDVPHMKLPPCHFAFQFYVANGKLSCKVEMRSVDTFLGLPFNIACYALLTHMVAQVCGLGVGDLIMSLGDVHIYNNHLEQANELLMRYPLVRPVLHLNPDIKNIDDFKFEDITLVDYQHHPKIAAPVSV